MASEEQSNQSIAADIQTDACRPSLSEVFARPFRAEIISLHSSMNRALIIAYQKSSLWERLFAASLFTTLLVVCFSTRRQEGFDGSRRSSKFQLHKGDAVYDDFYVSLYDDLVFCKEKNDFEIATILEKTTPTSSSRILDVGCGTGHHVAVLTKKGLSVTGMDASRAMVKRAQKHYPQCEFKLENAMDAMAFPHGQFTHILCLYFTVYYMKDKRSFFKNCYDWLEPRGYMVVHLVNRTKFDPIIPAGDPLTLVSAQRHATDRITKTKVKFNGYDYQSKFDYDANEANAIMNEEIINTATGEIRKNEHQLYMPSQREIIAAAKSVGFKVDGHVDMSACQYDTQYIYILRK